jgi:glycosyltransferase involved in cell wall biosynthesis
VNKIAMIYFYTGLIDYKPSVFNKTIRQFEAFKKISDTRLFIICQKISESILEELPNDVIIIQRFTKRFRVVNTIFLLELLSKSLEEFRPDFIYFRDVAYYPYFYRAINKKYAKNFVEVQTKLIIELELMNRSQSTKNTIFIRESILQRRYFKKLDGLITITDEISECEQRFNPYIKTCTIGNGYSGFIKNLRKINDNTIDLIFIGSPDQPWNNIERLLRSYDAYIDSSGDNDTFKIHIVGINKEDLEYTSKNTGVSFYGYISDPAELSKIYQHADIGVGTLGLYKIKINEAAPLKVREYLSYGLPVIIGYKDVDLSTDLPFVMQVENSDDLIDFSKIKQFYEDFKRYSSEEKVKDYCAKNLSWDKKCNEILNFMNSC